MMRTKYKKKQLIEELIVFMEKKRRRKILVSEYIKATQDTIHWSIQRTQALYSSVYETDALILGYRWVTKNEQSRLWVQVSRR